MNIIRIVFAFMIDFLTLANLRKRALTLLYNRFLIIFDGFIHQGQFLQENEQSILLGFLRPSKYGHYERERRWLLKKLPNLSPSRVYDITDLYIDNSRLRLRFMRGHGVADEMKLTKKGELNTQTRIITTIYLDKEEFKLFTSLPGRRIIKRRHYFAGEPEIAVDVFQGANDGLIMAEVEFLTSKQLQAYHPPYWFGTEVTNENIYSGGNLCKT